MKRGPGTLVLSNVAYADSTGAEMIKVDVQMTSDGALICHHDDVLATGDAKPIWQSEAENLAHVDVEGWKASMLQSDLPDLEKAELDEPVVRLLPYFDSFLLGHKSHRNIVDQGNHKKIYRNQGWVSPVLLVDGRAQGVWSHQQNKNNLTVRMTPFSRISKAVSLRIKEEASDLGRFLECSDVKTVLA